MGNRTRPDDRETYSGTTSASWPASAMSSCWPETMSASSTSFPVSLRKSFSTPFTIFFSHWTSLVVMPVRTAFRASSWFARSVFAFSVSLESSSLWSALSFAIASAFFSSFWANFAASSACANRSSFVSFVVSTRLTYLAIVFNFLLVVVETPADLFRSQTVAGSTPSIQCFSRDAEKFGSRSNRDKRLVHESRSVHKCPNSGQGLFLRLRECVLSST